jgi:hypothetical protein
VNSLDDQLKKCDCVNQNSLQNDTNNESWKDWDQILVSHNGSTFHSHLNLWFNHKMEVFQGFLVNYNNDSRNWDILDEQIWIILQLIHLWMQRLCQLKPFLDFFCGPKWGNFKKFRNNFPPLTQFCSVNFRSVWLLQLWESGKVAEFDDISWKRSIAWEMTKGAKTLYWFRFRTSIYGFGMF